jgi:membrane dipeptidase
MTNRRTFLRAAIAALGSLACNLPGLARRLTPTPGETPISSGPGSTSTPAPTLTQPPTLTPTQPTATPTLPPSVPGLIIDAHEDIGWNWLEFDRYPGESALEGRANEAGSPTPLLVGQRTTGLPQWLAGKVGVVFSTVFVLPARWKFDTRLQVVYSTTEEAHDLGRQQVDAYHSLAESEPQISLIETQADLDTVLTSWLDPAQQPQVGFVITMEGADPIEEPAQVGQWHEWGVRSVGPAWKRTIYSGGTSEPGPLTDLGRDLLGEMAALNMILDLSHIASEAYLEAVDLYEGPIIASHSNPPTYLNTDRGVTDEMILKLAARDGVLGIALFNVFLKPGWQVGDPRSEVPVGTVVEAIDYVAQLTGSVEHVAIGSDFDGGFGVSGIPAGMDTVADLGLIAEGLSAWGYSQEDVDKVMHGNWLRILRRCLPPG